MVSLRSLWKQYLVLEFVLACALMLSLGPEGIAREFCEVFPLDRCDELDFGDDEGAAGDPG